MGVDLHVIVDGVHTIYTTITDSLGTGLLSKANTIVAGSTIYFMLGFSVYVLLVVWDYYNRGIDESILELTKRVIGWFVIFILALNASNYLSLAEAIYNLPDTLSSWISGKTIGKELFDSVFVKLEEQINGMYGAMEDSSISSQILLGLSIVIVVIAGYGGIAAIVGMFLVAKASLALVLVLGPLFIGSMLFSSTRQYGMNWIAQCLNYSLTVTLYTIVMAVYETILSNIKLKTTEHHDKIIVGASGKPAAHWEIESGRATVKEVTKQVVDALDAVPFSITVLVATILGVILAYSVPSIAAALVGGNSISGHTRLTPMGFLTNPVKGAAKMAGGLANRVMAPYRANQAQRSQARTIAMAAKMMKDQK